MPGDPSPTSPDPAKEPPGEGASPSPEPSAPGRLCWRQVGVDAAVLTGLAGVAITQPMFDLFGNNPTFFVAGHYARSQILLFAFGVALVPALTMLVVSTLVGLAGPRARIGAHGVAVAGLAALFALAVCRTAGVDGLLANALVALATGLAVAVVEHRMPPARQFLAYLAIGNLAFLVLFLAVSPTSALLQPESTAAAGVEDMPPLRGPVIVVVLDEMPVTSLMQADGTINEQRFPNFARLAEQSTWFRDASAESSQTFVSVPTILSGRLASEDQVPTLDDHPRNLFTLIGDRYPVRAYEPVTSMCPDTACEPAERGSVRQMFADASVVYRHRVLPATYRDRLPSIGQSWGRFGDDVGVQATVTASGGVNWAGKIDEFNREAVGPTGQMAKFRQQVAEIDGEASLDFLHVIFPHRPYQLAPSGAQLSDTWMPADITAAPGEPGHASLYRQVSALQAMQFGVADLVIGEMIDHLEAIGAWDEALVVVTSDHGSEIMAPTEGRPVPDDKQDEVLRIPLFVKAPGQTQGETRDDPASTMDVVPTIVDLLDIETAWSFDGHSLVDGSVPHSPRRLASDVDEAVAVAGEHSAQFPGAGWDALAQAGAAADLVGSEVTSHAVGTDSSLRWSHGYQGLLADMSVDSGPLPLLFKASILGADEATPPEVAVAVNGTLVGTLTGHSWANGSWLASGILAQYFVDGANEVTAYEIEPRPEGVVLHPLPQE